MLTTAHVQLFIPMFLRVFSDPNASIVFLSILTRDEGCETKVNSETLCLRLLIIMLVMPL